MNFSIVYDLALNDNIDLFVDMDGVIASYDFGKPLDFINKRPLKSNIEGLRKISLINNVNLHILSVCRTDEQIIDKNNWLDINAPFFSKKNRHILSKESIQNMKSCEMKFEFLKNYKTSFKVVLVDDDNQVLQFISSKLKNILLFQDSALVD